jgi:methyl-accepting chemotaxis protein
MAFRADLTKSRWITTPPAPAAETETSAVAKRKPDIRTLADGFDAAVSEIIETVSSASTGLEAS